MPPGPTRIGDAGRLPGRSERAPVLQWIGVFLAPTVYFAHLQLNYVLVPWSCATHQRIWVHITSLVAVLLALSGIWAARRVHARAANGHADDDTLPRLRFLGLLGVLIGALFTLLLVAQLVAGLVISPCQ